MEKLLRCQLNVQILRILQFSGARDRICHLIFDRPTSCPAVPYYSSSLYILGIYALRVTPRIPLGSRFTWFAASAERKLILKIEKLMNPAILGCFSEFYNFFNFGSFWDVLAINFNILAWFPSRGLSQISLGLNFKIVQARASPNSFSWGRMFRSRCLGHSWPR